jgi:ADP-ribose pyrophosphatase
VAFTTPWFDVIAKTLDGHSSPHYAVMPHDYVTVLASDVNGDFLLVRQYRPVIEDYTLELPSGLVDSGESPDATARRELVEETGHEAGVVHALGSLVPDVGRLGNRMFCFMATDVRAIVPQPAIEPGLELVKCSKRELVDHMLARRCPHALNFAAVMLAVLQGHFQLPSGAEG